MVTKVSAYEEPKVALCLSTDEKPLDMENGSLLLEMDTGKVYFFDKDGTQWLEWSP